MSSLMNAKKPMSAAETTPFPIWAIAAWRRRWCTAHTDTRELEGYIVMLDLEMPQPTLGKYNGRQFVTGNVRQTNRFLADDHYSAALDTLVIVCVDFIPLHDGKLLLSRRTRLPHASWWVNGGRMRKGELYEEAAARLMREELGLSLEAARFTLFGHYSLHWDTRAQTPHGNGCHTLSVTHAVPLLAHEVEIVMPNAEYDATKWVTPRTVLDARDGDYHPALQAMVRDLVATVTQAAWDWTP
jgi:ADP-ribose pyrophosphatase YjhB (NUDIX family)